jgi:hypothetical protein
MGKSQAEIQREYRKRKGMALKLKERIRSANRRKVMTLAQKKITNEQARKRMKKVNEKKRMELPKIAFGSLCAESKAVNR